MVTPGGYLDIEVVDDTGIFSYDSTFFGTSTTVRPGKTIAIIFQHETSTFYMFRGIIESITPHPASRTATIYAVDAFERFNRTTIIGLTSTGSATGGSNPTQSHLIVPTIGSTGSGSTGNPIAVILDTVGGFTSTQRSISEPGATLGWWAEYNVTALDALHTMEEHELRGRIFIDGQGRCVFHSSTHRNGTTSAYVVTSADFQDFGYNVSINSVVNSARVTVHSRNIPLSGTTEILGSMLVDTIPQLSTAAPTNAITLIIPFTQLGSNAPQVPRHRDGSSGTTGEWATRSTRDLTGTTYDPATITAFALAAAAMQVTITNTATSAVFITYPPGSADTKTTLYVYGNAPAYAALTTTTDDTASQASFGIRRATKDFNFFTTSSDGERVAAELVSSTFLNPRPTGAKLYIAATDTETRRQILTRELGDKITVTSPELNVTSKVYEIVGIEYSLTPEDGSDTVTYGFLQATWNLDTAS